MIFSIPRIKDTGSGNFFLIAGPCVIENETMPFEVAEKINRVCRELEIPFIFKASYKKANRSRIDSFTGIGTEKGLSILKKIGAQFDIPVLTDVHTEAEAAVAAHYVDIIQIPAFLCRQTDLLIAAAKTGKYVNIKKGQFVSPESMTHAVEKVRNSGNNQIMLTERGSFFGYQDLVVDFRGLIAMKRNNVPVIYDVTHSLQQPNQSEGVSGGLPHLISTMAGAGIAAGFDGLFIETHPNPAIAKSDGSNMLPLDQLETLLRRLKKIHQALREE